MHDLTDEEMLTYAEEIAADCGESLDAWLLWQNRMAMDTDEGESLDLCVDDPGAYIIAAKKAGKDVPEAWEHLLATARPHARRVILKEVGE